jgi:hypothetical protein
MLVAGVVISLVAAVEFYSAWKNTRGEAVESQSGTGR